MRAIRPRGPPSARGLQPPLLAPLFIGASPVPARLWKCFRAFYTLCSHCVKLAVLFAMQPTVLDSPLFEAVAPLHLNHAWLAFDLIVHVQIAQLSGSLRRLLCIVRSSESFTKMLFIITTSLCQRDGGFPNSRRLAQHSPRLHQPDSFARGSACSCFSFYFWIMKRSGVYFAQRGHFKARSES